MSTIFKKVRLQKVSEEIANQIRNLIKDGKLQSGEKLPPERIFSEMFGVGRSSLREAINILETQGFVETRKRQGLYISSLSKLIISDPLRQILEEDKEKLIQLYEVRKDIELASIMAAAEHRTKADLEKIKQILKKMEVDMKNGTIGLSDDLEFHLAIAQSSHNIFRSHILKNIFDISDNDLQYVINIMVGDKANIMKLFEQHQNVFLSIEKKDSSCARMMMAEHLEWVEQKWKIFIQQHSN